MHIAAVVLSLVLALLMLVSGTLKFRPSPRILALADAVHLSRGQMKVLGSLQIAATVGLVAGLGFTPFALAASIGLVLYFAGAVIAHLRTGAPDIAGAIVFLVLSAVDLALLALA